MADHGGAPAKRPCGSCPYRRDVPPGVWDPSEYAKLPGYDALETAEQPPQAFFCHQQDGRLCAGWVGCHDMRHSLGLRLAVSLGSVDGAAYEAALDYRTDVPLWSSGAAAAEHGMRDPDARAQRVIARLQRKQEVPCPKPSASEASTTADRAAGPSPATSTPSTGKPGGTPGRKP